MLIIRWGKEMLQNYDLHPNIAGGRGLSGEAMTGAVHLSAQSKQQNKRFANND